MSTRLRRPAFWRPLALAAALVGLQAYLIGSALTGKFGIESQREMEADIAVLAARSAALKVEIDTYKHRASLFDPDSLDPDILTERARSSSAMSNPADIVMFLGANGLPVPGDAGTPVAGTALPYLDEGVDSVAALYGDL